MRVRRVEVERRAGVSPSTTDWMLAMTAAMQENQDTLTAMVLRRNPYDWCPVIERSRHQSTNPVYDLWLRLRGRSGELRSHRESAQR